MIIEAFVMVVCGRQGLFRLLVVSQIDRNVQDLGIYV